MSTASVSEFVTKEAEYHPPTGLAYFLMHSQQLVAVLRLMINQGPMLHNTSAESLPLAIQVMQMLVYLPKSLARASKLGLEQLQD